MGNLPATREARKDLRGMSGERLRAKRSALVRGTARSSGSERASIFRVGSAMTASANAAAARRRRAGRMANIILKGMVLLAWNSQCREKGGWAGRPEAG